MAAPPGLSARAYPAGWGFSVFGRSAYCEVRRWPGAGRIVFSLGTGRRSVSRRLFLALGSEGVEQQHRTPLLLFLFLGLFLLR